MIKDLKFEKDLINAISAAMENNGKTGEIFLSFPDGGARSSWVGKYNENDLLVNIKFEKWEEKI